MTEEDRTLFDRLPLVVRRFINRQRWRWRHISRALRLPPDLYDVEDPHNWFEVAEIEEAIENDRASRQDGLWGDEAKTLRFAACSPVNGSEGAAIEKVAQMRGEYCANAKLVRSITEWLDDGRVRVERHYLP